MRSQRRGATAARWGAQVETVLAGPGGSASADGQGDAHVGDRDDQYTGGHDQHGKHNDHHLLGVAVPTGELQQRREVTENKSRSGCSRKRGVKAVTVRIKALEKARRVRPATKTQRAFSVTMAT